MKIRLENLWHPHCGVTISELGEKRYLFRFYYEIDFDRFLQGSPWTFNNHLLMHHCLYKGEDPLTVPLFHVTFWVQIHDLPPGLLTGCIGRQFGNFIGEIVDYDSKAMGRGYRRYM